MRILLLAPDSEMAEVAREALADKSGSVEIVEALPNAALPIAWQAETDPNRTLGLDALALVLQLDLAYYSLEREEDTGQAIDRAFADHVYVDLGGGIT